MSRDQGHTARMAWGGPSQKRVTQAEMIGVEPGLTPADLPAAGWLPVTVPSDVYQVLAAADRLVEPDAAPDESAWSWVGEQESQHDLIATAQADRLARLAPLAAPDPVARGDGIEQRARFRARDRPVPH